MILSLIFVLSISVSAFASEVPADGDYVIYPENVTEFELREVTCKQTPINRHLSL